MINSFCLIAGFFSIFTNFCNELPLIDLSQYDYPSANDPSITYIPIMTTTDLHGYAFTRKFNMTQYGGVSLFTSYLKSLRSEWGDSLLYFDSGDKFNGALESGDSRGSIMSKYYNYAKVSLNVLGNHEFYFGMEYLKEKLKEIEAPFIATNLFSKETGESIILPNVKKSIVLEMGNGIRIGVIGFAGGNNKEKGIPQEIKDKITFGGLETILPEAKRMKQEDKVDAMILFIHEGLLECEHITKELNIYTAKDRDYKKYCKETPLTKFLEINGEGHDLFDAVVGGHVHQPGYYFINDIPIVHSPNNGQYFNLLYLPFDRKTHKLITAKLQIEGPIPVCQRVNPTTKRCEYEDAKGITNTFYFHKHIIRFDNDIEEKVLLEYKPGMEKYRERVCTNHIETPLVRTISENILGNIACDCLKKETKSDFALLNNGCFRSSWYKGEIDVEMVHDMHSFKNDIVSFELTGKEVFVMMRDYVQVSQTEQSQTAGMREWIGDEDKKVKRITMLDDDTPLDEEKMYKVAAHSAFRDTIYQAMIKAGDAVERELKTHGDMLEIIIRQLKAMNNLYENDFWEGNPAKRRIVFFKPEPDPEPEPEPDESL